MCIFAPEYEYPSVMARSELSLPFASLSGKLSNDDKIILRTRNGRTHAYVMHHPYKGPVAPARQRTLDVFASAVVQAKTILSDAVQRAEWEQRFAVYQNRVKRHPSSYPKPCATLRGFIISTLVKESSSPA